MAGTVRSISSPLAFCAITLLRLSFIDNLGAIIGEPTNFGGVWILRRLPAAHEPSASQLQKPTDRPDSIFPGQIYNLSAGKHVGGLEVGEPSSWSRYNRRCSVCSTWAHFTLQQTAESIWAPRWKTRGSPSQSSITWRGNRLDSGNKTATYDASAACAKRYCDRCSSSGAL